MMRQSSVRGPWIGAALLVLEGGAAAASLDPRQAAFRARHGSAWSLAADPATGRPRRLVGGATPLTPDSAGASLDAVAAAARSFLERNAALLGIEADLAVPEAAVVASADGTLVTIVFEVAHGGVRVSGSRVVVVVSRGKLTAVHLVGTGSVSADPAPSVPARSAIETSLVVAGLAPDDVDEPVVPRLVFLPLDGGHRLAWEVWLIERAHPRRWLSLVDARSGQVLALTDQTVSACDPAPPVPARRVTGGVRPERADEAEREELLPFATVGGSVAGRDGLFVPPPSPHAGRLTGPASRVDCVGCTFPIQALAPASPDGDVRFGSGGVDAVGNGLATPADRAAFFHAEGIRRHASRWLDVPFVSAPVPLRVNLDATCNAYWDGRAVSLFRSGGGCANTGEIRDVVAHEWGHALDQHDGQPSSPVGVDAATGEGVGDVVAMLRSRDACVGESFRSGGFPSAACSGVRDLDEKASGHELGAPATLTTGNVAAKCAPSAFYRGPLGREGHCEGQLFGQAFWHLVQNLLTGVSYADGAPVLAEPLGEDQAWEVAERLFYAARPVMASQAPARFQGIGPSAYDAFLLADDEGDGIANGTPHALAIHDAFAHHGLEESSVAPSDTADCVPPPDPIVAIVAEGDRASGLPSLAVSWTDTGGATHEVLRADDEGDAFLLLAEAGPGAGSFVDRGVLPGRTYRYRVVARAADGCTSASASAAVASPGALLRVTAISVADPPPGGNGDGALEEGETAEVFVELGNDGLQPARRVVASLTTSDPALAVTGPPSMSYGTLLPGGRVPAPSPFLVTVGAGTPPRVHLVISAESDDGCLRDGAVVEVRVRDLHVDAYTLDDAAPGGDGDGAWRAGEAVTLAVAVRNDGALDADPVDGTIAFDGPAVPGVTITDATASWGLVAAGGVTGSLPPHFALRADASVGPRTRVPLLLTLSVGRAVHRVLPMTLVVGAFPAPSLEWSLGTEAWGTPIVLPLQDTDGDGRVTACDMPAVVALGKDALGRTGVLAWQGDGSGALWTVVSTDDCEDDTVACTLPQYAIAGGDVDGDGANEVIVSSTMREVTCISGLGEVLWTTVTERTFGTTAPQVWDLDADGRAEIVVGGTILDGAGDVVRELDVTSQGRVVVADLDLDGKQEIIAGPRMGETFRADGTVYPASFPSFTRWGMALDVDGDPWAEIVYAHEKTITARHHDGSLAWQVRDVPWTIAASPPCAGDVDGDGRAEILVPTDDDLLALDDDGSVLWTAPARDVTGMFGSCSVFDFDGDARPEVVYKDQARLAIYDGLTGERLWEVPASSSTLFETPVVADCDGDGSAEIVLSYTQVGSWTNPQSLHVFGNPDWLPARATWNQESYSVTHVQGDGSITRLPTPSWHAGNVFKGQASDGPCDCSIAQPSFTLSVPDCGRPIACFVGEPVGTPLGEPRWDFGDGSPEVVSGAPCHEFPAPGVYQVRMRVGGDEGCPRETGRFVEVRTDLLAEFLVDFACAGRPTCVETAASGGVPPYASAWDFGDGSPLVLGDAACHAYAGRGPYLVTHFVRDARGCLQQSSQPVALLDPATLPEVSGPSAATPLRVRRSGDLLELSFSVARFPTGVYRGDLQSLRTAGYTHEATPACGLLGGVTTLPIPAADAYFLAVAAACEAPREEGPYGTDSFGRRRPTAGDLGRPICP